MLYVFHGSDETVVANKRVAFLAALRKKRPEAEVFVFDTHNIDTKTLDDVLYAQGLFFSKHIIVLNGLCEKADTKAMLVERASVFGTTEHVVIVHEAVLDAATVKALAPHAKEMSEHKKVAKKMTTNPFAIAEALAQKNRKELWLSCVEQLRNGAEAEMILGTLHWQVRMLLFAKQGVSAEDAGVKPYALQKAARCANNFTMQELRELSRSIVRLYHDAHRGIVPMHTGLERWCLLGK